MIRAVAWNAGAKWATQVFTWVATFLVARLLRPYDYGLVGMAGIYLGLAALISQIGIADAVITLRDLGRRQLAELNTVALLLGIALVLVSSGLAFPIARFFAAPPLRAIIIAVSTTYVINGLQVIPRALLQKELRFKLLASIETVRALAQMFLTLLFAWLGFGYWSLVYGPITGSVISTVLTLCWRRHGFAVPQLGQLYRELRFSGHVSLSGIAWYIYSNADFLVAGRMLGEAPLGNYSLAWTISSAPIEKVGNLITGVTPAFFSAVQTSHAELRRYFLRLSEAIAYLTVPASFGIVILADLLIPTLLGPKWSGVISPLRILGALVAFRSLTTILPKLLIAINDAKFVMWITVVSAVILPAAFLCGSHWGTIGIAIAWLVSYPPVTVPFYYRIFQRVEITPREYLSVIAPALTSSAVMSLLLVLLRSLLPAYLSSLLKLILVATCGVLFYIGALVMFYRRHLSRVSEMFRLLHKKHETPDKTTEKAVEPAPVVGATRSEV
jgi:PST family polysaccharide transporter